MPPVGDLSTSLGVNAWTIDHKRLPAQQLATSDGLDYRTMMHSVQARAAKGLGSYPVVTFPVRQPAALPISVSGAFEQWPWVAQVASLGLAVLAAMLAASHAVSAAAGLAVGFLALTVFFFGSFAACRRGVTRHLFGPNSSLLGMLGSLIILLAICINLV
jgi:hypothetical protein